MTDELNVFGSWHDLVDALKPKSLKGKRVKKWKARVRRNRGMRTRAHKRELLRDRAKFVRTVVEGPSNRSRPNAPKLTRPRDMAAGRWLEMLRAMGDDDWTMPEFGRMIDRSPEITGATVKRYMLDRGFVERRPNPNPPVTPINGGMMAGKATRTWTAKWLYRRTTLGEQVAQGLVEWRKPIQPNVNTHKYLRLRQAKALAAKSGLAQGLIPDEA